MPSIGSDNSESGGPNTQGMQHPFPMIGVPVGQPNNRNDQAGSFPPQSQDLNTRNDQSGSFPPKNPNASSIGQPNSRNDKSGRSKNTNDKSRNDKSRNDKSGSFSSKNANNQIQQSQDPNASPKLLAGIPPSANLEQQGLNQNERRVKRKASNKKALAAKIESSENDSGSDERDPLGSKDQVTKPPADRKKRDVPNDKSR